MIVSRGCTTPLTCVPLAQWPCYPYTKRAHSRRAHSHASCLGHATFLPRLLCTWTRTYWSSSIPIKYRRFWGSPSVCALRPRRLLHVTSSYEAFLNFALPMPPIVAPFDPQRTVRARDVGIFSRDLWKKDRFRIDWKFENFSNGYISEGIEILKVSVFYLIYFFFFINDDNNVNCF